MYNGLRVIDSGSHDHRGHDLRDTDIDAHSCIKAMVVSGFNRWVHDFVNETDDRVIGVG